MTRPRFQQDADDRFYAMDAQMDREDMDALVQDADEPAFLTTLRRVLAMPSAELDALIARQQTGGTDND